MNEVIDDVPRSVSLPESLSDAEVTARVLNTAELLEDKMPLVPFHIGSPEGPRRVLRRALPLDIKEEPEAIAPGEPTKITPQIIVDKVSEVFGVNPKNVRSNSSAKGVPFARQTAIYMISNLTDLSIERIGKIFSKEPGTVIAAINKLAKKVKKDKELAAKLKSIEESVKNFSPASGSKGRVIVITKLGLFECLVHQLTEEELQAAGGRFKEALYIGSGQKPDPKLMKRYGRLAWQQMLKL